MDCVDKSRQNIEKLRKFDGTSHIEVISYPCGFVASCVENDKNGEGASWNMLQHELLLLQLVAEFGDDAKYPLRLFIDDACSTIVFLLNQLACYSRGETLILKPWVLFALLAGDISVDGFHWRNHVEKWCEILLNPKARCMPPGFNSEVGEQNFQKIVKHVGALREMNAGRHRFFTLTFYAVQNKQMEKTPFLERDTQTSHQLRSGTYVNKHALREEHRKAGGGAWRRRNGTQCRGRFAVPCAYVEENPNGYPPGFA